MSKKFIHTEAHEKFCQFYSEFGNGRQAFMYAWPETKFSSAGELSSKILKKVEILERIEQIKEEFKTKYHQDKDKTIRDLIDSAEQAKEQMAWTTYAKLREMVIKMKGFYEPEKIEHSGEVQFNLHIPGVDEEQEEEDSNEPDN